MKIFKAICLQALVLLTSGCSLQSWYPERFDSINEVYPAPVDSSLHTMAPESSKSSASFPAPYSDVFAVAERSATQNQWNVISADEGNGTILATRAVQDHFRTPNGSLPADRRYHYVIGVQETSAADTRVWVVARTQGACLQANRGAFGAMSFGISEAYIPASMKSCKDKGSKTDWAVGTKSAKADLDQLVVLMRNNLMALGYE